MTAVGEPGCGSKAAGGGELYMSALSGPQCPAIQSNITLDVSVRFCLDEMDV